MKHASLTVYGCGSLLSFLAWKVYTSIQKNSNVVQCNQSLMIHHHHKSRENIGLLGSRLRSH